MSTTKRSFHYRLFKSIDNRVVRVRLTAPAPDEMCPLTFSPVSEDVLDFLPGLTFLENSPHVKQATLPCGHVFGALSILYHFARRNMLCPCCRRGVSSPINPKHIPKHLRAGIVSRVANEIQQERAEQMEEDMAFVARDADQSAWAALVNRVQMSVYPRDAPFVSFEYQLNSAGFVFSTPVISFPPSVVFALSADDSNTISSHLRDLAVTHISLVVHARSVTDRVVELARTDAFEYLGALGGDHTVDSGVSRFSVSPIALKWTASIGLFHSLLQ
jgi:hypothetical protein